MSIGSRIKRIRTLRGMTQKELGIALGYSAKSADIRIAQYESGKRTPKEDVIDKLASILSVSSEALQIPDIESYHGLMFTLFEFEEEFNLTIDKIDDTVCLHLNNKNSLSYLTLLEMLNNWYQKKQDLDNGTISIEEYTDWKLNYPRSNKPTDKPFKK